MDNRRSDKEFADHVAQVASKICQKIGQGHKYSEEEMAKFALAVWSKSPPQPLYPPPVPDKLKRVSGDVPKDMFKDDVVSGFIDECLRRYNENMGNLYWAKEYDKVLPHPVFKELIKTFTQASAMCEAYLNRNKYVERR
ncbi:MAG: hypothetical protein KatS3mg087_1634 [Patescibacteria group bacterium]|nr:MAG: hypothetical protein KatS3mg087_1634 [Patescibacteria group bacterium]